MPRARKKPSAPQTGLLGRAARIGDRLERLEDDRTEMMRRGAAMEEVARLDRQITSLELDASRLQAGAPLQKRYARALSGARKRGRSRDQLAHLACFVPELTPELLQAADVYRLARGVDLGWLGCPVSFLSELGMLAGEGGRAVVDDVVRSGTDGLARWKTGRRAEDLAKRPGTMPSTFKPKARNKRVRRPSDGGMAAMMDRALKDELAVAEVLSAYGRAVHDMGFDERVLIAADRVVLHDSGLVAAAKGVPGRWKDKRREILSSIVTGLNGVSSHLRLKFGSANR